MTQARTNTLTSAVVAAAARWPERPALEVDGTSLSYADLMREAAAIADAAVDRPITPDAPTTAVLAHRSVSAFAGIVAALVRGGPYVPLHPDFPPERTAEMVNRSGADVIIVGSEAHAALEAMLAQVQSAKLVILADEGD
ncbi:MAG: AMP-binding protein, partial [Planctomycetota bacterium]